MFRLLITILFLGLTVSAIPQTTKVYFDRNGKGTNETNAYYYRVKENDQFKSYYIQNGNLYFEGRIINANDYDEQLNKYQGTCTWYYKNSNKKTIKEYNNEGVEQGKCIIYYESGKVWKEINYNKGKITGTYDEYTEDGQKFTILEDDFNDNSNDWDVYKGDQSEASIENGALVLTSLNTVGTSRYIASSSSQSEFIVEANFKATKMTKNEKYGIVFSFKDWDNYCYFFIDESRFYTGKVFEGIHVNEIDGMYAGSIVKDESNSLKVIVSDEGTIFTINGQVENTTEAFRKFGPSFGIAVSGKETIYCDKIIYKEVGNSKTSLDPNDHGVKSTGTGLVISNDGYLVTNYHVIDNATSTMVELVVDGNSTTYNCKIIQSDKNNDLAVLKIDDPAFKPFSSLQYSFKNEGSMDVGSSVFTIGYPLALSGMGKEAKFTDGKISAKTGYNGELNSYQTTIPVQPGNSGGPVFNDKGELVAVINSKINEADNVSYAIKLNYLKGLIESLPETISTPKDNSIQNLTLEEKIKVLSKYVVLIKIK